MDESDFGGIDTLEPDSTNDDYDGASAFSTISTFSAFHDDNASQSHKIGQDDICKVCGGRGHWAVVNGKPCLTTVLGLQIPKHQLAMTRYPYNLRYPLDEKRVESKSHPKRSKPRLKPDSSTIYFASH